MTEKMFGKTLGTIRISSYGNDLMLTGTDENISIDLVFPVGSTKAGLLGIMKRMITVIELTYNYNGESNE